MGPKSRGDWSNCPPRRRLRRREFFWTLVPMAAEHVRLAPPGARRWLARLLLENVPTNAELTSAQTPVPLNAVHALAVILANAELSPDEHAELFRRFGVRQSNAPPGSPQTPGW